MTLSRCNVADRLAIAAAVADPGKFAVLSRTPRGERAMTFAELEADAAALARGLVDFGVRPGTRLALLVPPSPEFVALVFALLRSGATMILIDPGMGGANLVRCLSAAEPEGFVAVSRAQAVRTALWRRFPHAKLNVTVGRRWFWGGATYDKLLERGGRSAARLPNTTADDPAAIIFTSGSTGPAKGVLYTHGMFESQVVEIQRTYDIQPGGVDLACFALFGLFNAAMGVSTVFPNIDFSRPASADPAELLTAGEHATQAFASPAIWDKLSRYCEDRGNRLVALRKVFSCGAPVRADVIRRTLEHVCLPGQAEMHTPYGATEALPVSTIEAREVLGETAAKTAAGAGVCVGRKFDSIDWRVIAISDEPIATIDEADELPPGEIGELIVRGPQVSTGYDSKDLYQNSRRAGGVSPLPFEIADVTWQGANAPRSPDASAKVRDGASIWHRMGDVGYFDDEGRFWYCGRKSHRVQTSAGTLYTECVEAIFNEHPDIERSALVGIGAAGQQVPVMALQFRPGKQIDRLSGRPHFADFASLVARAMPSKKNADWLDMNEMPVDVRHNAKINREELRDGFAQTIYDYRESFEPALVESANTTPVPRSHR
jgi:olefin beta-lactone synthetase